jgi:hypothetical protein
LYSFYSDTYRLGHGPIHRRCSFDEKIFCTRIILHSLNPIWDEKLFFHVREYESTFKVQLTVLDWDKLSNNGREFKVEEEHKYEPNPTVRPKSTPPSLYTLKPGEITHTVRYPEQSYSTSMSPVSSVSSRTQWHD